MAASDEPGEVEADRGPSLNPVQPQTQIVGKQPRARLSGHKRDVELQFNQTGDILASFGSESIVRLWDVATAELRRELHTNNSVSLVVFSPDEEEAGIRPAILQF